MSRQGKDWDWRCFTDDDKCRSTDHAILCTLMDIRDELKEVKQRLAPLSCPNFLAVPSKLDRIAKNTKKAKRRVKR